MIHIFTSESDLIPNTNVIEFEFSNVVPIVAPVELWLTLKFEKRKIKMNFITYKIKT